MRLITAPTWRNDRFRRRRQSAGTPTKISVSGVFGGQERGGADMASPAVTIHTADAELVLAAADTRPNPTTERFDAWRGVRPLGGPPPPRRRAGRDTGVARLGLEHPVVVRNGHIGRSRWQPPRRQLQSTG